MAMSMAADVDFICSKTQADVGKSPDSGLETADSTPSLTPVPVRRKLFDEKKAKRGPRHIEAVRLRRKRYRKNKKKARQENWERSIIESVSARWTRRHEEYLEEEKDAEKNQKQKKKEVERLKLEIKRQKEMKAKCEQEIACHQEDLYQHVVDDSMQINSFGALLLPSVTGKILPPAPEKASEELNGLERIDHASAIKLEKERTKQALDQARYYRNLAEKLRKEKRNAVNIMNEKVEAVRDFW